MGRAPCCDKANVKRGPWSPEEDAKLKDYIHKNGFGGNWISLPQKAGLKRCGKSCRLRWLNYLRPNIKHGEFTDAEDRVICSLYSTIGSRWSIIAAQLPGRTDNDIKNYWNTKLKKKLMGFSPSSSTLFYNPVRSQEYMSLTNSPTDLFSQTLTTTPATSSSSSYLYQPHMMFGGEHIYQQANSCTSSDGSQQFDQYGPAAAYNYKNVLEEKQRFMFSNGDEQGVIWDSSNPLEYSGLEDIKHLISSSSSNNASTATNINIINSGCSDKDLLFDEIKTKDNFLYY
ncbi:hypothetical protein ACFE04_000115 [Oxalis oulophora]